MFERDYPEAVLIAEWFDPSVSINAGFHVDFWPYPIPDRWDANDIIHNRDNSPIYFSREGR